MRQFAITDIHGCAQSLRALVEQIQLRKEDSLFLLGDYVDRGPDSKGVFDFIFEKQEQGFQVHCLRGNHEQYMLDACHSKTLLRHWLLNGGAATLRSFGVGHPLEIPQQYLQFAGNLPYFFQLKNYLLVHAGLDFKKLHPLKDKKGMLWIRDWYDDIDTAWLAGRIIVHGHTQQNKEVLDAQLANVGILPVINIDNGCVTPLPGRHQLIALDLGTRQFTYQPCVD